MIKNIAEKNDIECTISKIIGYCTSPKCATILIESRLDNINNKQHKEINTVSAFAPLFKTNEDTSITKIIAINITANKVTNLVPTLKSLERVTLPKKKIVNNEPAESSKSDARFVRIRLTDLFIIQ